jgi:hypothetical protein
MKWIWLQWLLGAEKNYINKKINSFVNKGMKMQDMSLLFYMRPIADLYLLHCAIFSLKQTQMEKLANRVVDASGIGEYTPKNDGELYASAWCGMLKYWILGDRQKAVEQSEFIGKAYRPPFFSAASKQLVLPWLKSDWKGFVKAQQDDFDKLWVRAGKDGTIQSKKGDEILVTVQRYPIEQKWCWAHCGMALLAYRQGVEVATDPLWFPPHALKSVDIK